MIPGHWVPTMLVVAALLLALGAVARPALRIGGEWAGWCCGFDPFSGALRTGSEFQAVTTERWAGTAMQRRSLQLLPDDGNGCMATNSGPAGTAWSTLPVAVSGSTSLMPGARAGLFGAVQVDMLNANAWALDEAVSANNWRCESIFDGLGGERPREKRGIGADRPQQRTRVVCSFDPNTGQTPQSRLCSSGRSDAGACARRSPSKSWRSARTTLGPSTRRG